MGLSYLEDTSAADWIATSATPFDQLVTFGPAGYAAYVRLRFIPDPTGPGQSESEVELPPDHQSDIAQTRQALHRLSPFTGTPDSCYFCVWEGYSDIVLPADVRRDALVSLPHRRYGLLHGPLADIDLWEDSLGVQGACQPPAIVWPADRRWCFASDVDPHWAGIGADQVAVAALLSDPGLDVVPARPDAAQPTYY